MRVALIVFTAPISCPSPHPQQLVLTVQLTPVAHDVYEAIEVNALRATVRWSCLDAVDRAAS